MKEQCYLLNDNEEITQLSHHKNKAIAIIKKGETLLTTVVKGHSPLELLTGKPWPEFIDLLEEYGFWDKGVTEQVA